MSVLPGTKAPNFYGLSYLNDKFLDLSLEDFNGSWLVLFFYPVDFCHIAASELLELNKIRKSLASLGCRILGVSRDSVVVHEQYEAFKPSCGGVHGISFPLLEDVNQNIARTFGVLKKEAGYSFRGFFILNPEAIVRARVVSDLPVGIQAAEILRLVACLVQAAGMEQEDNAVLEQKVKPSPSSYKSIFPAFSRYYETNILCLENYPISSEGMRQSPIAIKESSAEVDETLTAVTFMYKAPWDILNIHPQPTSVLNDGRGWKIPISPKWQARMYNGPFGMKEFRLFEMKAHWGSSEHSLDGQYSEGELHLMHHNLRYKNEVEALSHSDGIAIVSILMKEDAEINNPEIEKIADVLNIIQERGTATETAVPVQLENLLPENMEYFTYPGSFTSPDYREIVEWIVMKTPIKVSPRAFTAMKNLCFQSRAEEKIRKNVRPVCAVGDRIVRRFVPQQ